MKHLFYLISLIFILLLPFSAKANKLFCPECPERYDPNTEILIRGKIKQVWVAPKHKFLIVDIERKKKIYRAIIGPSWFVNKEKIRFEPDEEIIIKGAKFVAEDGKLFIFTRSIYLLNKDRVYHLRDKKFKPRWKNEKLKDF